jgi:NCAIR mutase (PurE)-related protein
MTDVFPGVFDALRSALLGETDDGIAQSGVWLDPGREQRTGTPEVILAAGKRLDQLVEGVTAMLARSGHVVVSRVTEEQRRELEMRVPEVAWRHNPGGRTLVGRTTTFHPIDTGGRIGILTAGASDFPTADEARLVAEEMGCTVRLHQDVGVAGLHRLFAPLRELLTWEADVLVVAAGMDGTLASVVSGLVPIPVIGLPTAIGYGAGGRGEAALLSMLQTCAPGLVVVNIDNGIGAGIAAARIARLAASARRRLRETISPRPREG